MVAHPPAGPADRSPGHLPAGRGRIALAGAVVLSATLWAAVARVLDSDQPIEPWRVVINLGFGALAGALVGALLVAVVYRLTLLRRVPSL